MNQMTMNMDELMKLVSGKRAEIQARSGRSNLEKLPPGKSRWRILPGWRPDEPLTFFADFKQHFIKDGDGKNMGVFVCESHTFGRECEACNILSSGIRATKDDPTIKILKEMLGRGIYIVNALRRDGENASKTPVLVGLPTTVFDKYLSMLATRASEGINLLDMAEGRDITITRTGANFETKYDTVDAAVSSNIPLDVLENLHDIDAWMEAERKKGIAKGFSSLEASVRIHLADSTTGVRHLAPPAASLLTAVPPSRMIEADPVEDTDVVGLVMGGGSAAMLSAKPKAASKPIVEVDSSALSDDELQRLVDAL